MRISDWSSDVCSSDLITPTTAVRPGRHGADQHHNQDNQKNGADAHGALREMAVKLRLSGDCNPTSRPHRSAPPARPDRTRVVKGKCVSERLNLGGSRIIKKKRNRR